MNEVCRVVSRLLRGGDADCLSTLRAWLGQSPTGNGESLIEFTLPIQAISTRLLVVDDDENNRDMLARRLERRGFTATIAVDGPDALKLIAAQDPFDLILLDIEMPGLSGFDVLRELRLTHDATTLPVIVATARTDRDDIVAALGLGANDYVTKPLDFPVVVARVETQLSHKRAVDRIRALEAEVRQQNAALSQTNERMRQSLQSAARVQQLLLPDRPTMQMGLASFAWKYRPCDELGGDILNVFALAGGAVGMYLLDVSGHGVPAALLSVSLSRVLSTVPGQPSVVERLGSSGKLEPTPPAEVAAELNRRFPMGEGGGQYFTMFYAVLNPGGDRIDYVSAAHPPALLLRDQTCQPLPGDGFALGWFDDITFDSQNVELKAGDRLIVYSDGVTETFDNCGEQFGAQKLADHLSSGRGAMLGESLDGIVSAIDAFRGCGEVRDDVTLLAMQRM